MIRSKVVEQYLTIFTHKHMRNEKKIKKLILLIDGSSLYLERDEKKSAEENIIRVLAFNVSCLQSGKLENIFPRGRDQC